MGDYLIDMVAHRLKELGADGLCNAHYECGCGLDELFPCAFCDHGDCMAAKCIKATEPGDSYEIGDEIYVPMTSIRQGGAK